jgi:hypothetical protein
MLYWRCPDEHWLGPTDDESGEQWDRIMGAVRRAEEAETEVERLREDLATANDEYNHQFIGRSRAEDVLDFAVGFLRAMARQAVVEWGDLAGIVRPFPMPLHGGLYRSYARKVLDRIAAMRKGGQDDAKS